jgi:hypothetical protein
MAILSKNDQRRNPLREEDAMAARKVTLPGLSGIG